jgi:hypothetical protein
MASVAQLTGLRVTFSAEVAETPKLGLTIRMAGTPQFFFRAVTMACPARCPSAMASAR